MKEKHNRELIYNSIIRNAQGKEYLINEAIVKEEQCFDCIKRGKVKQCRLYIENERCKNYEKKMDKRNRKKICG